MSDDQPKDDAFWREKLSPEEYRICREKGTERAFTGQYWDHKGEGVYRCKCCGVALFGSNSKFDSGSGWPSFYEAIEASAVGENEDRSLVMPRTEIICAKCDSHLGHVFPDGPESTGLRYCVNSGALDFDQK
ncbi:MAG: peptide-methionine (R)-S-oxide reductase MsrB [Agarilytica sp.]